MKPSESAELVMMLVGAYPSSKPSAATSQVYEAMLADLDVKAARAAVHKLIATSKWFPTVAEVREACGVIPLAAPYHRVFKPQAAERPALPAPKPRLLK